MPAKKRIYSDPVVIALSDAIEDKDRDIAALKSHVMRLTRHAAELSSASSLWITLTRQQQADTLKTMRTYGGGFVAQLADAWDRADETNSNRLGAAFDDVVRRYGPDSAFYGRGAPA